MYKLVAGGNLLRQDFQCHYLLSDLSRVYPALSAGIGSIPLWRCTQDKRLTTNGWMDGLQVRQCDRSPLLNWWSTPLKTDLTGVTVFWLLMLMLTMYFNLLLRVTSDTLSGRPEDHRWCVVPVSEEACQCDDPHRVLLECLRPYRVTTVYGHIKAEVCAENGKFHLEWYIIYWDLHEWNRPESLQQDCVFAWYAWVAFLFPLFYFELVTTWSGTKRKTQTIKDVTSMWGF